MRKNKQILVLALSSLLVLAGCGNNDSSSNADASSSDGQVTSSIDGGDISSSDSDVNPSPVDSDSSDDETKKYSIATNVDSGATVTGLPPQAEAGAEIHFVLNVLDGFELNSIEAKSGTNTLSLTEGLDGDYSFTMPKRGVTINVTTIRKKYEVTINDSQKFIESVTQMKVGASDYSDLDTITETDIDEGEEVTTSFSAAEFGATIKVDYKDSVDGYKLMGIKVNGESVTLKKDAASFTFTMPSKATSVSVSYDYTPISIKVNNSEHITLSLYQEDKITEIKDSYTPYKDIYVKAVISDNNYAIKALTYTGINGVTSIMSSLEDGYYHFNLPKIDAGVTITVSEYNLSAYKDYNFVGEYSRVYFGGTSAKDVTSFVENSKLSIASSGDITYKVSEQSEKTGYLVSGATSLTGEGMISTNQNGSYSTTTIAYDDNCIVFDSYFGGGAETTNDISVGVKVSDANAVYTTKSTQFKMGDVNYALASFYKDAALIENVLIERKTTSSDTPTNTIRFGVAVEMLEGDYVSDAEAIFRVKDGDDVIVAVGYQGEGGAKNRVALGDEYGDYTSTDNATLYLNGISEAKYNGDTYAYTIDGTSVVLSSNDKTVNVTIDVDNKTFTVTKEESASTPAWYGKTYKGTAQWGAYDEEARGTYTVVFHDNEAKFDLNCTLGNAKTSDIEYEVSNGTTITTKFYDAANKNGFTVTLVYNATTDKFTANGGVNGAYFKNTVFSLVA